jgi:hypothetical protein
MSLVMDLPASKSLHPTPYKRPVNLLLIADRCSKAQISMDKADTATTLTICVLNISYPKRISHIQNLIHIRETTLFMKATGRENG